MVPSTLLFLHLPSCLNFPTKSWHPDRGHWSGHGAVCSSGSLTLGGRADLPAEPLGSALLLSPGIPRPQRPKNQLLAPSKTFGCPNAVIRLPVERAAAGAGVGLLAVSPRCLWGPGRFPRKKAEATEAFRHLARGSLRFTRGRRARWLTAHSPRLQVGASPLLLPGGQLTDLPGTLSCPPGLVPGGDLCCASLEVDDRAWSWICLFFCPCAAWC